MSYWFIKTILVIGMVLVAYLMMRPVKNASHLALRRLLVIIVIFLASLAVIFPDVLTRFARSIGVYSGINLIVYILVLAVFTQMAIGYRRDAANERKLTSLARSVALNAAPRPPADHTSGSSKADTVGSPRDE